MSNQNAPVIAVAGALGDLGGRIVVALVARGAKVRALVRPGLAAGDTAALVAREVEVVAADPMDRQAMAGACAGAACVISALNGLEAVMIGRQTVLIDAAVLAGVARFIPSDFAADFTKSQPGRNRNFDLRRRFMAYADGRPIRVTSVLNGAFMDMLGAEMPIIQPAIGRILYWHDADQVLDFTMKDDVAAYTAAAAMDAQAPRLLRIAGASVSVRQMATVLSGVAGRRYRPQWVGSLGMLSAVITVARRLAPQPDEAFPAWQGMQYMRDQFEGHVQLAPLDSGRYADLRFTGLDDHLATVPALR